MSKPKFIETYELKRKVFIGTTQARISEDLYNILKIIKQGIKEAHIDSGRNSDISEILNCYIDWKQLQIDAEESSEYIQKSHTKTLNFMK